MGTFLDDYARPDGPLGNGWVDYTGSLTIVSGEVKWISIGAERFATFTNIAAVGQPIWSPTSTQLVEVSTDAYVDKSGGVARGYLFIGAGLPTDLSVADSTGDDGIMFEFMDHNSMSINVYNRTTGAYDSAYADHASDWPQDFPGRAFNYRLTYDPATRMARAYKDGVEAMSLAVATGVRMGDIVGFGSYPEHKNRSFGESFFREFVFDNFSATGVETAAGPTPEPTPEPTPTASTRVRVRGGRTAFQRPRHSA